MPIYRYNSIWINLSSTIRDLMVWLNSSSPFPCHVRNTACGLSALIHQCHFDSPNWDADSAMLSIQTDQKTLKLSYRTRHYEKQIVQTSETTLNPHSHCCRFPLNATESGIEALEIGLTSAMLDRCPSSWLWLRAKPWRNEIRDWKRKHKHNCIISPL